MKFSPVLASKALTQKYKRYLSTVFALDDPDYEKQFLDALGNEDALAKGPYLDVTDAFVKGRSIADLMSDGVLAKGFEKIHIPPQRPLHRHQERAIQMVRDGRNIVVSTGTGSGKTEAFLIPIFDYLVRQHQENRLKPGVRALLIYPMNALANDQIERLRGLLADYPKITYGSYTGQTKEEYRDALAEYQRLNGGKSPADNELIARKQMKDKPPHILITNYAMLEYLMLRPEDNVFFDGPFAKEWKFIVLDEAHVYNGSTGIEVSMLLRRLNAKIGSDRLNYILTSATLGGENENEEVARFAESLSDQGFAGTDVIRAERISPEARREYTRQPIHFYTELAALINQDAEDQLPDKAELYDLVLHDSNYWEMRTHLQTSQTVSALAELMHWTLQQVEDFVTVASYCEENGDRLFDARYHMFLRATESVFIALAPSKKLFLTRKSSHLEGKEEFQVFEVATCSSCHAIYLVGKLEDGMLKQTNVSEDALRSVFLLGESISDYDEDHPLEEEKINATEYELCAHCGYLKSPGATEEKGCGHAAGSFVKVYKIDVDPEHPSQTLTKCLHCENINNFGILRMFFSGQEASTSVIGTALFEELPSYSIRRQIQTVVDDSGFGFADQKETVKVSQAKQFIAFSDNRQAAAFYASYLNQTYQNILYRRLVLETTGGPVYEKKEIGFHDFIEDLVCQFENHRIASHLSTEGVRKEAWKAALHELVDNSGTTSLYSMGLFGVSLNGVFPENKLLHLSAQDVQTVCNVFAMSMMSEAAILYDANLNSADKEFFTFNGVEHSFTLSDGNSKGYQRAFIPAMANKTNKRLDYLKKVLAKSGYDGYEEQAVRMLQGFWNLLKTMEILKPLGGEKYRIDSSRLSISRQGQWYQCPKCRKITANNAFGVCPSFRCDGELQPVDLEEIYQDNHYYRMYQELDIRELRAVEHTAQLDKDTAYDYQRRFKEKEIDILSCSTTFEMGVDVGTLETVFMRNMPPSPSNYAQRAGRAGRSIHASAYAVTFCNKSSHDFTYFKNPERMIKGRIEPPKFNVENHKIAIRHVYASAFAYFWRGHREYFKTASVLLEKQENGKSGCEELDAYLYSYPEDLKLYLNRFLPASLRSSFMINSFGWLAGLTGKEKDHEGVLTKARNEYEYEVGTLEEARTRAQQEGKKSDYLLERIRVYKNEDVLSFLSKKNVLPKYGFPVDTVEMVIVDKNNKTRLGLQLQRDLSMAISEYAPDSQIVANGNLITSRYIRKVPNMNWKQFDYAWCPSCKTLNIEPHVEDQVNLNQCANCKVSLEAAPKNVFLVPQFGFEADGDRIRKPGLKKPQRTYRGEVAYVGYKTEIEPHQYQLGHSKLELLMSQSDEMAVLNEAKFFVCETCGYTVLNDSEFKSSIRRKHERSSGYHCVNDGTNKLKKFALGYRFETDVVQLRFLNPDLSGWEQSLSVLYGVLRGLYSYLNIEQNDVSGCLQYFFNEHTHRNNFSLILYDKTPGGAGHVRRLNNEKVLEGVLTEALRIMDQCDCGGPEKDSSCYGCLRGYYNQKQHDLLKRSYVIEFLKAVLDSGTPVTDFRAAAKSEHVIERMHPRKPAVFHQDGQNMINENYQAIWDYLDQDTDLEAEHDNLTELKRLTDQGKFEKPFYYASIKVIESRELIRADLVWPHSKVLLFLDSNQAAYTQADQTDWYCFLLSDSSRIADLVQVIREK